MNAWLSLNADGDPWDRPFPARVLTDGSYGTGDDLTKNCIRGD